MGGNAGGFLSCGSAFFSTFLKFLKQSNYFFCYGKRTDFNSVKKNNKKIE
jgi:hypothetical protein